MFIFWTYGRSKTVGIFVKYFAYRASMPWWIFVLAGVAAMLIALLTVSFETIRAATANPVKSLRVE